MKIFPAIDLHQGQVVRLLQGDYDQVTRYALSPAEAAAEFAAQGADCLHLVDLDGARDGGNANFAAIAAILSSTTMFTQVGGGIRDEAAIRRYLEAGASRVILGTVAVRDPAFTAAMAQKYGPAIAVGVDAREGRVAVEGWRQVSQVDSHDFCRQLAASGVGTVIYTDISRDGALRGIDAQLYAGLQTIPGLEIVASGGVTCLADIVALRQAGVAAAIIGKALYSGGLRLADALRVAAGQEEETADDL